MTWKSSSKAKEGQAEPNEEKVDHGPSNVEEKPKGRKWKLQARNTKCEEVNIIGLTSAKRPSYEMNWPSLENKRK